MHLTAVVRLLPTEEQAAALSRTLTACNAACNWIAAIAIEADARHQYAIQALVYRKVRERFGLAAQATVRCIAKVADSLKTGRKVARHFRPLSGQPYDSRIFRFVGESSVSIWTLEGRVVIPFAAGEPQRAMLAHRKGEVDLLCRDGMWLLGVTCDVPAADAITADDVLGVDLGIVALATDSDGTEYSGAQVELARRITAHRRRNLQRKGTKAAKRKLRRLSGTQARYQRNMNHTISKRIVATAQRTGRGIALEDLTGIRGRVTARRRQRARFANWSFYQLGAFIRYKAEMAGVPVTTVDPRHTSQRCPTCGHIDRANRISQAIFSCVSCGFAGAADHIAAVNIRWRARAASQPADGLGTSVPGTSSLVESC